MTKPSGSKLLLNNCVLRSWIRASVIHVIIEYLESEGHGMVRIYLNGVNRS